MQTQALYRRWRSQSFAELVGQEHVTRLLLNALRQARLAHAYLFCGPRGTGKTSTARILAKAANCDTNDGRGEPCNACPICEAITAGACLDVIEIDAASNRGIDDIRVLRDNVLFTPTQGRLKFYIVDEAHQLTKPAFDALLKTLEEPPPHVVFVLASTSPDSIPITIRSRCQRLDFRPIPQALTVEHLATICEREGIQADPAALLAIARASEGSLRDAESLLDQLAASAPVEGLTAAEVEAAIGVGTSAGALALVERLVEGDSGGALRLVHELAERGADFTQFGREVVRTLRALLLVAVAADEHALADLPREERERAAALARATTPDALVRWVRLFALSELPLRSLAMPQLGVELACVEALSAPAPQAVGEAAPWAREAAASARDARAAPPRRAVLASGPPRATPSTLPAPIAHAAPAAPAASPRVSSERPPLGGEPGQPPAGVAAGDAPADDAAVGQAPPSALTPGEEIEPIRRARPQVIEAVGQRDRRSQAVLRDSRVVGGGQGRLLLGFRYDFHRAFLDDPKRRIIIEEAIAAVCRERWRIECARVDAADERPSSALDDPLVREALATMGGHVKSLLRVRDNAGAEQPAGSEGDPGRAAI
ncbi:MAG: DNA polymerase III subunit gamma/tau [Chloroflexi bacterium]|nr:DNA polymerase III subunit gamma/tau [Chloroflexota bacterium]